MSFIKRLKNVLEAKANKILDKHENPIEMLELSIKKKEELLTNAKKQCANFIATVDSIRDEKREIGDVVQVTSLPISGKVVILDAGHGTPDERCRK